MVDVWATPGFHVHMQFVQIDVWQKKQNVGLEAHYQEG